MAKIKLKNTKAQLTNVRELILKCVVKNNTLAIASIVNGIVSGQQLIQNPFRNFILYPDNI